MGKELADNVPEATQLYCRASEIVGYDLAEICFTGPPEKLNMTEYAQPAIFVTSAAALLALKNGALSDELSDLAPDCCAGLSLGEYTALYAAGALSFDDALRLVQIRGKSMQQAADQSKGTMVSLLGMDSNAVDKLCQATLTENVVEDDGEAGMVCAVNYNCPGQIVISGTVNACLRAAELASEFGAIKAVPLKVAGAFHTSMMTPATEKLRDAIAQCAIGEFQCPVIANVDAQPYSGADDVTSKLLGQLVNAVRWQQSIELLLEEGFQQFVEIGPGRVLTGLVKKISRARKQKVKIININKT